MQGFIEAREIFSLNVETTGIIKQLSFDKIMVYQLDGTGWPSRFAWIEFTLPESPDKIKMLCELEEQIDLKNIRARVKYVFPGYKSKIMNFIRSLPSYAGNS